LFNRRAYSVLEYLVIFVVVIAALLVLGSYIHSAMQGQFRTAGATMADLRQHETSSQDCAYDDQLGIWYSVACVDNGWGTNCRYAGVDNVNMRAECRSNPCNGQCPFSCCQENVKRSCAMPCAPS
jgi:hypothetical protein